MDEGSTGSYKPGPRAPPSSRRTVFATLGRDSRGPRPQTGRQQRRSPPSAELHCPPVAEPRLCSPGAPDPGAFQEALGLFFRLIFKIQFKDLFFSNSQTENVQAQNERMRAISVCNKHFLEPFKCSLEHSFRARE